MTFLAMASQKSLLILQKSQANYEKTILMSRTNCINKQMADYANSVDEEADLDEDPFYIELEKTSEYLQVQASSLDDQISTMNEEINALKNSINTGIKETCSLSLQGG